MIRALALVLALAAPVGCHHEDPPPKLEPGEKPPLPPSSGTPIGFLLDDASELTLKDEQIAQLQGIDQALQGRLDAIDTQLRGYGTSSSSSSAPPPQGRRGRRGGGPRRQRTPAAGTGAGSAAHAGDIAKLAELRKGEVRDALGRAFALFDMPQKVLARKVLAAHDVDLDDAKPARPAPEATEPVGDGSGEP